MLKEILLLFMAFFLPVFSGWAVISALDRGKVLKLLEKLPLSFGAGAGLLSFYMFIIGVFGAGFSFFTILPFFIASSLLSLPGVAGKKAVHGTALENQHIAVEKIGKAELAVCLLLGALMSWKLFFILFNTFAYPSYFYDAISTWDYKAKVFFFSSGLGLGSEFLGGGAMHYPLGTMLFKTWIAVATGVWRDAYIHLYPFVIFVCSATLFFAELRRHASFFVAFVFTYIFVSLPLNVFHAYSGYADIVVGYYLLSAALMLSRWFQTGRAGFLYISLIFTAVMMFIKNEGVFVYLPVIAVSFVIFLALIDMDRAMKVKMSAVLLLGLFLLIGPWLVFMKVYGLSFAGVGFELHPEALREFLEVFLREGSFNVLWPVAAFILLLNPEGFKNRIFLSYFVPAVLAFLVTIAVFVISPNYQWLYSRTTINRTLLIAVPLIIFSLGVFTGLRLKKSPEKSKDGQ